jgi:hypothetical protein
LTGIVARAKEPLKAIGKLKKVLLSKKKLWIVKKVF